VHGATGGKLRLLELGAGSAAKTGVLLDAAVRRQGMTEYLPIDVSETAMADACASIARALGDIVVRPQVANYVTDTLSIPQHDGPTLALYIGSSIGNFNPDEAAAILRNLRAQLRPGDTLLLGTDLVKDPHTLISAYNDHDGVTEAFNLNVLRRINRDLRANFDLAAFKHQAVWNAEQSRIEMHLQSTRPQTVRLGALSLSFTFSAGETIHTENSYKFTQDSIRKLFAESGFRVDHQWTDENQWFAVTVASAI
jgi:dimethylhistidine N-methyltransferase